MEELPELKDKKVAIVGAGPAGLSAAYYLRRLGYGSRIFERMPEAGGMLRYAIPAYRLPSEVVRKQVGMLTDMGVRFHFNTKIGKGADISVAELRRRGCRAVILAAGTSRSRKIPVEGGELPGVFWGLEFLRAVRCGEAPRLSGTVAVVGGGDVAVEDAIFLARICEKVYVVHRRDEFRADRILQDSLRSCENVEIIWDSVAVEIQGAEQVTGVKISNVKTGQETVIHTDGVFIAVGIIPNTQWLGELVPLDETGYIIAGEEGITGTPGIFAAGDVRTKMLRQVVTAVADGANAVVSAQKYLIENA